MTQALSGIYSRGPVPAELSSLAFVQAMLDVESALARAVTARGLVAADGLAQLLDACHDASSFDVETIERGAAQSGTPVPALLAAVRSRVGEQASAILHHGATSQDIVDSAVMLLARRALGPLDIDLAAASERCAELARTHRRTVLAGRTLLQQALPVTFGLKAATWLGGLSGARVGLIAVRDRELAVQLGGAVGTLAAFGEHGLEVAADLARELGLAEPTAPWHTIRLRPARMASALGAALGVMGKIARDLVLLAQTEVGEAAEAPSAGRGGSSAMPHKHNPVGAVAVLACAQRGPGLVATVLSAMVQEHERAAGPWQGEWGPLIELLALAGSAAASLGETLGMLEVDAERMRANVDAWGMAESVASALGEGGLDAAPEPTGYLGVADALIDRALAEHEDLSS